MKLVEEIRCYCARNTKIIEKTEDIVEEMVKEEALPQTIERRPRAGSFATRKISLTCETLARSQAAPTAIEPSQQLLMEPKRTGGRLRSPAPSPIPSPVASPSPTRSRFQVSRVSESDSPVTPPSSSSSPNVFFGGNSRFKVTVVESSSPTIPTTVLTSNNVTVGFETPANLSASVSVSPAPSPTPIPAPLLSSIPSLFPTPMPSPMPSPGLSPNPSPTYISPLSTINVGEAIPISPLPSEKDNSIQKEFNLFANPFESDTSVPVIVSDSEVDSASINDKDVISNVNTQPANVILKSKISSNEDELSCETVLKETVTEITSNTEDLLDTDNVKSNISFSSRDSVSPPKVCKSRSESEESDKDFFLNRKLPKAIDSIDLSALRVMKQASVSVSEKPTTSTPRVRKISSWVQPSAMFSSITQDDSGKPSSGLERLLGLFVNPFLRSKVEEEPSRQLELVPEIAECSTSKRESTEVKFSVKTDIICDTYVNLGDSAPKTVHSNNSQSLINDSSTDRSSEPYKNDSINDPLSSDIDESGLKLDVKSDNCTLSSCPTRNGCEPICDKQDVNIPFIFNSNDGISDSEFGGMRCKTWPQGTSMAQLNLIHPVQNQSHSTPCLTALVFLNSKMSSNLTGNKIFLIYSQ